MSFERRNPETERLRMIEAYANEAEGLAKEYEYPHNIWTAIRNVKDDRTELFRQIKEELRKRKKKTKKEKQEEAEYKKEIEQIKKEDMMKDARAHELRQPRDAWDPFSDED